MLILSLKTIGLLFLIVQFQKAIYCIWRFIILIPCFNKNSEDLVKKYGSWALITGCTDGIGKAYAKELACRGINVILVSRNQEKLTATAKEIESKYSVETKIVVVDFTDAKGAIEIVKTKLKSFPPIGILVNNVGVLNDYTMSVGEIPEKYLWDTMRINIETTTMMTRLLINEMQERGTGAIVNISSVTSIQHIPFLNVYSASKVYIDYFTKSLREEYSNSGLTIQLVNPCVVSTNLVHFLNLYYTTLLLITPDAETYAKSAIKTLGKLDHTTGYWSHDIQYFLLYITPTALRTKILKAFNKFIRQKYFKGI